MELSLMLPVKIRDHKGKHIISIRKVQTFYRLQRKNYRRILIHPLTAEFGIACDGQIGKKCGAVFSNIEKVGQHTHAKRFPETARACDQRNLRRSVSQEIGDETAFVNIVIISFSYLLEVRDSNRNTNCCQVLCPLSQKKSGVTVRTVCRYHNMGKSFLQDS